MLKLSIFYGKPYRTPPNPRASYPMPPLAKSPASPPANAIAGDANSILAKTAGKAIDNFEKILQTNWETIAKLYEISNLPKNGLMNNGFFFW